MDVEERLRKIKTRSEARSKLIKMIADWFIDKCVVKNVMVRLMAENLARGLVFLLELDREFGHLFDLFDINREAAYLCSRAELLRSAYVSEIVNCLLFLKDFGKLTMEDDVDLEKITVWLSNRIPRCRVADFYKPEVKPKDFKDFWSFID